MPGPYRIATPPEPLRTEEADTYERTLVAERARDRRTGALLAFVAVAVLATAFGLVRARRPSGKEEAQRRFDQRVASARRTIAEAKARVNEEERRFQGDVRAAIDAELSPPAPPGACPSTLVGAERLVRGRPSFPLTTTERGAIPQSASIARIWRDALEAERLLEGEAKAAAIPYADAFDAFPVEARLTHEVVLVRKSYRAPARTSPRSYEPGVVDGVAYLYDWREHRVICAGEVHAENTATLEYSFNDDADAKSWQIREPRLDATLAEDLETQVARAIAAPGALLLVGPLRESR